MHGKSPGQIKHVSREGTFNTQRSSLLTTVEADSQRQSLEAAGKRDMLQALIAIVAKRQDLEAIGPLDGVQALVELEPELELPKPSWRRHVVHGLVEAPRAVSSGPSFG